MARVQVGYDPRAEALQTTAAPNVKTVQANFDLRRSSAFQLAEALGATSVQQGIAQLDQAIEKRETEDARAWANSRTVKEVGDAIQNKEMLPSQSPVFVAAVNHTYGENSRNQFVNETISKMNRGELTFASQEELEKYLVDERNKVLAGRDRFAIAGFDKAWGQVREQIIDANNKVNDRRFQEHAMTTATAGFATVYEDSKKAGATPGAIASNLLAKYDLFRESKVLMTPETQRAALKSIASTLAMDGNLDALNQFLDSNLPNNGPKVRFFMDTTGMDALTLQKQGEAVVDRRGREDADNGLGPFRAKADTGELDEAEFQKFWEPRQKYIGSATIQSIISHNRSVIAQRARILEKANEELVKANEDAKAVQAAEASIAAGRPVMDYVTADGRTLKAQDIGQQAMDRIVGANQNMAPQELIRRYALSGIENKQWKREFGTAVANIGETTMDANGKPVGQLMPATLEALDKFAITRQVSEGYARELAGSERNYETLVQIQALREAGAGDVNWAASIVNQINKRNISGYGNVSKDVNAAVEKVIDPSVFTGRWWGEVFRNGLNVFNGEQGEGDKNTIVIKDAVRKLATTYILAGLAANVEEATVKAAEYYADPRITTQINNTIYRNADLPDLPEGMDRTKWFSQAMDGVVGAKLSSQGIKYNRSDLTLIPMEGGNRPYMISLRGRPTGVFVTREEMKSWIMTESDKETQALIDERNKPKPKSTITYTPDPKAPSIYASPEEWRKYRESQKAK